MRNQGIGITEELMDAVHEGQGGYGIPTFSAPVTAPTVAAELAPST